MATIIVGHNGTDLDCVISMLALEAALKVGYSGEIRFAFVNQGETYQGIKVDPRHQYETLKYDRIYHVDCGGGALDHHQAGCTASSSAVLVDQTFQLSEKMPEWKRLVKWATEADRGRLSCGCALHAVIRGQHRLLGSNHDAEIFGFTRRAIEGLLENEKLGVAGEEVDIDFVDELEAPDPADAPALFVEEVPAFGKIGVMIASADLLGSLRNRMEREAHCRLMISFSDDGRVGIMSRFALKGRTPVDLRQLGIVQAIRTAEATTRGITLTDAELCATGDVKGMKWFAHEFEGRIANLFCGSAKVDLQEGEETRLSWQQIIKIVKDCITTTESVRK